MAEMKVVHAFSEAAYTYDENAIVQKTCALDLLNMITDLTPQSVLDVGCGTGLFTRLLTDAFPTARVLACDPAKKMLKEARQMEWPAEVEFLCCGVADLPSENWDLIASNAALHWAGDLDNTLSTLKQRMTAGGTLAFSYFTNNTYPELAHAMSKASRVEVKLPSAGFASSDEVAEALDRVFTDIQVERKVYTRELPNLRELLSHIKLTGTRGNGTQPRLHWTRDLFEKVQNEYLTQFGSIVVSSEVALCTAK